MSIGFGPLRPSAEEYRLAAIPHAFGEDIPEAELQAAGRITKYHWPRGRSAVRPPRPDEIPPVE
ncbi:hypothetical protein [Amycolatopsis jejuensis]|uniref:hypothetical protein n=1 Tax=Amycolatopsis jejuensis TaxID=330084 RepID=UPI0005260400|nr:hypothetical protein [Amycolatopsis jejuensis]